MLTDRNRRTHASPWLVLHRRVTAPRLRLVCFPFAGGAASFYRPWATEIQSDVELWAVELPGRGSRMLDPPVSAVGAMMDELMSAVVPITDRPLVLFGHSMGAELAFELCRLLCIAGNSSVMHIIVSGRAPHGVSDEKPIHALPDSEFLAEVRAMGGLSDVVLESPELLEIVLPGLRADFTAIERWSPPANRRLPVPITVLGGDDDDDSRDQLARWAHHTHEPISLHMLPGGHFFLSTERRKTLALVRAVLDAC